MSLNFHGDSADWLFHDSPPVGAEPWHELHRLAERAGVSVEHLCATVETATHFTHSSKANSSPSYNDDLEEVIRALEDDNYGFDFELEAKAEWHEADHPRDENGRFTNGGGGAYSREEGDSDYSNYREIPPQEDIWQFKQEMQSIHGAIQQILNMNSRWSKSTFIVSTGFMPGRANGRKSWKCHISIGYNPDVAKNLERRMCTMLHEALHALSPTTQAQYEKFPGWEEATIEWVVRLQRNAVARQANLDVSQANFKERDTNHAYKHLVDHLERIRQSLYAQTKSPAHEQQAFYNHLITLDIPGRKKYLLDQLNSLPAPSQEKFWEVLKYNADKLNAYKGPPIPPTKSYIKSQTLPMTRDELLTLMFTCRTPEAIHNAEWEMYVWMKQHPDDFGIQDGAEMVVMRAEALGIECADNLELQRRYYALYPSAQRDANDIPETPESIFTYQWVRMLFSAHTKEDMLAVQKALDEHIRDYPSNPSIPWMEEMCSDMAPIFGIEPTSTDEKL